MQATCKQKPRPRQKAEKKKHQNLKLDAQEKCKEKCKIEDKAPKQRSKNATKDHQNKMRHYSGANLKTLQILNSSARKEYISTISEYYIWSKPGDQHDGVAHLRHAHYTRNASYGWIQSGTCPRQPGQGWVLKYSLNHLAVQPVPFTQGYSTGPHYLAPLRTEPAQCSPKHAGIDVYYYLISHHSR